MNSFRILYKKTGNIGDVSNYELVSTIGNDGIKLDIMKGCTSDSDGQIGVVPKPNAGEEGYVLCANGTWTNPNTLVSIESKKWAKVKSGIMVMSAMTLDLPEEWNELLFIVTIPTSPTKITLSKVIYRESLGSNMDYDFCIGNSVRVSLNRSYLCRISSAKYDDTSYEETATCVVYCR